MMASFSFRPIWAYRAGVATESAARHPPKSSSGFRMNAQGARFSRLRQGHLQNTILQVGRHLFGFDLHRKNHGAKDLIRAALRIDRFTLLLFFLGLPLTRNRYPVP